jgi:hypothetical protein
MRFPSIWLFYRFLCILTATFFPWARLRASLSAQPPSSIQSTNANAVNALAINLLIWLLLVISLKACFAAQFQALCTSLSSTSSTALTEASSAIAFFFSRYKELLPRPHAVQTKYSSVAPFDVLAEFFKNFPCCPCPQTTSSLDLLYDSKCETLNRSCCFLVLDSHLFLFSTSWPASCWLLVYQPFFSLCRDPCCNLSTRISTGILHDWVNVEGAILFRFGVSASSDPRKVAGIMNCIVTSWNRLPPYISTIWLYDNVAAPCPLTCLMKAYPSGRLWPGEVSPLTHTQPVCNLKGRFHVVSQHNGWLVLYLKEVSLVAEHSWSDFLVDWLPSKRFPHIFCSRSSCGVRVCGLQSELVLEQHSLIVHLVMAQLLVPEEAYLLDKVADSHHCQYGDLAVQGLLARLASPSWSMVTFPQSLKL